MTVLVGTIQERKDTSANWTSANPVLLDGEYGLETDTKKRKLGDGSTAWNLLAYYSDPLAEQMANKGQANGYAPLNGSSQIPQQYLPSFVDDVLEFANLAAFPATGETGKIYIAIDTGKQYRWSGSSYIQITNGLIASTDDVPEGSTNKYSTNSRVLAYLLTGLSAAASRVLPAATDSLITAWGKVLKYLTDLGGAAFLNVGTSSGTVAAGNQAMPLKSLFTVTSTISNTGNTTENVVAASQNLVGLVEANDQFYLSYMVNAVNNGNTKTARFYISDSPTSLVNAQLIGLSIFTTLTPGATLALIQKAIWMRGSLNATNNLMYQAAASNSFATGASSLITVDLTSSPKYIVLTMQNAVGADTFYILSLWTQQFRP